MLRRRVRGILDDPYDDFDAEENPVEYVKVPPPTLHTPRGTPIFVPPRSVDRSGFIDVLLAWRHKFPLEFALIVFFSFMSRFWRVSGLRPCLPRPVVPCGCTDGYDCTMSCGWTD